MRETVIEWSGMANRLIGLLVLGCSVRPGPAVGQTDPVAIMEQVDRLLLKCFQRATVDRSFSNSPVRRGSRHAHAALIAAVSAATSTCDRARVTPV